MRVNSKLVVQATYDSSEAGEGLAIFFSQNGDSEARYRFIIYAITSESTYEVGRIYSSPPLATPLNPGPQSRMIGGAVCPGALSWAVNVECIPTPAGIPAETAEIILASTRCFAQIGVARVSERYNYIAGTGAQNFTVVAGQKVTGIAALGLTGGGTVSIGGGDLITIPAGSSISLNPKAEIAPNAVIAINNCDYVVEYLESA